MSNINNMRKQHPHVNARRLLNNINKAKKNAISLTAFLFLSLGLNTAWADNDPCLTFASYTPSQIHNLMLQPIIAQQLTPIADQCILKNACANYSDSDAPDCASKLANLDFLLHYYALAGQAALPPSNNPPPNNNGGLESTRSRGAPINDNDSASANTNTFFSSSSTNNQTDDSNHSANDSSTNNQIYTAPIMNNGNGNDNKPKKIRWF